MIIGTPVNYYMHNNVDHMIVPNVSVVSTERVLILKILKFSPHNQPYLPTLDESVQGLDLNAAVGLTSYSRDELWKAHGPQTLQEAYSFVGRVVDTSTEKKITKGKAVQQILLKTARDTL